MGTVDQVTCLMTSSMMSSYSAMDSQFTRHGEHPPCVFSRLRHLVRSRVQSSDISHRHNGPWPNLPTEFTKLAKPTRAEKCLLMRSKRMRFYFLPEEGHFHV